MSEQKFPPRIVALRESIKEPHDPIDAIVLDPDGLLHPIHDVVYVSLSEHQHLLAEKEKRIMAAYAEGEALGVEHQEAKIGRLTTKVADLEKRLLVAKEALKFYSRTGGASDTNDRKGCWILARRFIFGEAIAHDFEKIPYGETGTEYLLAGKRAREAIAAIEKEGR